MKLVEYKQKNGISLWKDEGGFVHSIDPPDAWIDINIFPFMMPYRKPFKMLILGVGKNTLGRLCKMKDRTTEIVLVDKYPSIDGVIAMDGFEFVKTTKKDEFDFTVIDAYENGVLAPFVSNPLFIEALFSVTTNVILNLIDQQAEMITPWLESKRWAVHRHRKHNSNNIWFLKRAQ